MTDVARAATGREPTIVDVARRAAVSVSTVSRVVRDLPDVRPETRARVQDSISQLGYRPSPIARALVSGRTRLLALLVSDITNPFYPQLAKSVEQEAKRGTTRSSSAIPRTRRQRPAGTCTGCCGRAWTASSTHGWRGTRTSCFP